MADRTDRQRALRRFVLYPIQGAFILLIYLICRVLPIEWASWIGSITFRTFGPFLRADKTARRNLARIYPDISQAETDRIVKAVWDNLGRGAGEWSQVDLIETSGPNSRVEVIGEEHLLKLIASERPFITFSGHFGNWEIASLVPAHRGLPLVNIYRHASIPIVDHLFRKIRGRFCREMIPKGRSNARRILESLKSGHSLGLLVDQKLNEGLPIPFLGYDAMTPSAPAELAYRFDCPIIPARVERLPGVRFRLTILPPMEMPDSGDRKADVEKVLRDINDILGEWILDKPEQWFWVHSRWPKE